MRVSACLIVKDEEKTLARCIRSLQPVADEIIVVDTGSKDNTIRAAEELGAKVYFFPWIDDFSAARNFAIEKASGDWILMIDADEELLPVEPAVWKGLMQAPRREGYFVQILSQSSLESPVVSRNPSVRLFRKRKEYHYTGRIHEQILPQILRQHSLDAIGISTVELRHYGYTTEILEEKNKIQRNIHLLQLELKKNPREPFMRLNLGIEYYRSGEFLLASWHLRAAQAELKPGISYYPYLVQRLGLSLACAGEIESSVKVFRDGIRQFPDYTDLYFYLGEVYWSRGQYHLAIEQYKQCLEKGDAPALYVSEKGVGGCRAWQRLGYCHQSRHEIEEAVTAYTQSLAAGEPQPTVIAEIIHLLKRYYTGDAFLDYMETYAPLLPPQTVYRILRGVYRKFSAQSAGMLSEQPVWLPDDQRNTILGYIAWKDRDWESCGKWLISAATDEAKLLLYQLCWYRGDYAQCGDIMDHLPADFMYTLRELHQYVSGQRQTDTADELPERFRDTVYAVLENWVVIGHVPGMQAIFQLIDAFSSADMRMTAGKILYDNGYYQEAIHQFGCVGEGELNGESLAALADMARLGDECFTAVNFITSAMAKDHETGHWLTYLKILLYNANNYVDKALVRFPDHPVLREMKGKLREEFDHYG